MEKMNCDIIQDLIPSYVDGICSEASRNCIEEHIKNCTECGRMVTLCQNNALTGNQAEQKALDGFRKIKEKMKYLFIVNIILTTLVCFCIQTFLLHTNNLILSFSILLAICMCINLATGINGHGQRRPQKADYITCALSIMIDVFIALLLYYTVQKSLTTPDCVLFGLEAQACGPILDWFFLAVFIIQLLFFFYYLLRLDRRKGNTAAFSCLAITGAFLASAYRALLRRLDTPDSFWAVFFQINIIGIIIATLGILISLYLTRKFQK